MLVTTHTAHQRQPDCLQSEKVLTLINYTLNICYVFCVIFMRHNNYTGSNFQEILLVQNNVCSMHL